MEREPSREQLKQELTELHQELTALKLEKADLEIMLENITEHADAIESELRARNKEIVSLNHQLALANKELEQLANLDGLTEIANRRHFDETLDREWRRMSRQQQPLSLILGDIDFFKRYNDTYGHQAGDWCLKQVAAAFVRAAKRPSDLVARYGGEEIAVVLPNTDCKGGLQVASEIRSHLQAMKIEHGGSPIDKYVTLSLGIATIVPTPTLPETLLVNQADTALYQAKKDGRNRTVFFRKGLV
ncbi:diguanylate cyclase/phosphodiesterase (GGDEF & EAL domains) with PAS/PAC sensor(s) [Geitlerinema sp. FC II]|nr:diguanylate cyclase [Geitlerinema sp. CS-897]PPT07877.1 diguanylate cyclase/phosphodiesterase (GGDEF & EAL domains) with PAS/PAC sensor(s) [Geitlerinema sp. FC II]